LEQRGLIRVLVVGLDDQALADDVELAAGVTAPVDGPGEVPDGASDPRALVHDEGIVVAGLNVLEEDLEAEGVRPIRGGESKDDENAPVHVLGTADDVNMI
jgi:hypothetical protein